METIIAIKSLLFNMFYIKLLKILNKRTNNGMLFSSTLKSMQRILSMFIFLYH